MKPIYLCGPINGRSDDECMSWRAEATRLWSGPVMDPMRRDYRGRESLCANEIVSGDMEDIRASCGLLVFFDKPSVGAAMEVFFAKAVLGLPVVVINAHGGPVSPWLQYHSDAIVVGIKDGVTKLRHLVGVD